MKERLKNLKNKKVLVAVGILLVALIGGTLAYFSTSDSISNIFTTEKYSSKSTEVFTPPTDWAPGDTTPKTVTVTNTGTMCENVRVSYSEKWESKNGDILPNTQNGESLAIINLKDQARWVKNGDYYYYNKNVMPGEQTTSFIESVTYNPIVDNDFECVTEQDGVTRTCSSSGDGYDGATYTLSIHIETIQCDVSSEAWNVEDVTNLKSTTATLDTGDVVNQKWKTLAAGASRFSTSVDTNVTTFQRAKNLPPEINVAVSTSAHNKKNFNVSTLNNPSNNYKAKTVATEGTDYAVISASTSDYPIYAWYDGGVIYYYSEAAAIALNSNSSNLFFLFRSITGIGDLENADTSKVTRMDSMFADAGKGATTFSLDLSGWNTSRVTNMGGMYEYAGYSATSWSIDGLSNWDTSNVTAMFNMFNCAGRGATTFNLDLSNWNTSSVIYMNSMFNSAGYNATSWSIGDLSNWDTSKVTNMSYMFAQAGKNATSWVSIGKLDIYAENIEGMFSDCRYAKATLNLYSNPESYDSAFDLVTAEAAASITVYYGATLPLSDFQNGTLANSRVTFVLKNASLDTGQNINAKMKTIAASGSSMTYSSQDTNITSILRANALPEGFSPATGNTISLSTSAFPVYIWYEDGIIYYYTEAISVSLNATSTYLFSNMRKLSSIAGFANANVATAKTMNYMFNYAGYSLTSSDTFAPEVSSWNTSEATNMSYMFYYAGYSAGTFNIDVSNWNVSKVTTMASMFRYSGRSSNTWKIGTLNSWTPSVCTTMTYMFSYAGYNATWTSIGMLNTYATTVSYMFQYCPKANATLNLRANPTTYTSCFASAATGTGASITVNYVAAATNVDTVINTKSSSSNVVKGSQIT